MAELAKPAQGLLGALKDADREANPQKVWATRWYSFEQEPAAPEDCMGDDIHVVVKTQGIRPLVDGMDIPDVTPPAGTFTGDPLTR